MIKKCIYKIGARIRNPELKKNYEFLKKSENWSIEELENYQFNRLKILLKGAYECSPYYQRMFFELNMTPEDIESLADLSKLPIINKNELIENSESIQQKDDSTKMFLAETSGSTGEPITFYKSSEWDSSNRAAQLRGYSWHDVKPWERNGYFWGFSFSHKEKYKMKIMDYLVNRYRLFSYDSEKIVEFSKKLKKATYIEGYSSMIYEVAQTINEKSLGPYNLKMVKGTAEKIYDSYQPEVIKAFGQKMISEYGSAEAGIIAFECPSGNMHITMEHMIVEEVDGEAIITNLNSTTFPIIRYKIGDSIILNKNKKCDCGKNHYIIEDVLGRTGKKIYGYSNKYPSLTLYYIFKNIVLKHNIHLNYQAKQSKKGFLTIDLEQEIDKKTEAILMTECQNYFSDDVKVEIRSNTLKRNYDQKFKDFISEID